jgi:competence protein ComEC
MAKKIAKLWNGVKNVTNRRVLSVIAAAYAAGIGCAYLIDGAGRMARVLALACLLVAAAGVCGLIFARRGRSNNIRIVAVALVALVIGGVYCTYELGTRDPLEKYAVSQYTNADYGTDGAETHNEMPQLTGRVLKYAKSASGTVRLTVRAEGRKLLVQLRSSDANPAPRDIVGRRISFKGAVEIPLGKANPGCFNYRLYLRTQGVNVIVKCDAVDILASNNDFVGSVTNGLARFKYGMAERLENYLPKEKVAVITGLLFGMDDDIDEDTLTMFRENGVYHILSVSGMHVAILYAAVFALFGKRRTIPVCVVSLVLLLCYAALAEFTETVMRALTMIVIHIVAQLTQRRYDFLTGICAAGLILLLVNPLSLFNAGFQLSFLAVLLLAFSVPFASRFTGIRYRSTGEPVKESDVERTGIARAKRIGRVADYLLPVICVQIGLVPVTAYMFNIVSPLSLLANLPVAAVSGLLIPLGMAVFALQSLLPLPDIVFGVISKSLGLLTDFLTSSVSVADALPLSHFKIPSPPLWSIFAFYALALILMSESFRLLAKSANRRGLAAIWLMAVLLVSAVYASPDMRQNRAALTFVDVGQGDCLHIRTPGGKNYIIDGGGAVDYEVGKKVLYEYFMKNGIGRLDGVFVTHLHTDHMKGVAELSSLMSVGTVFLSEPYRGREGEFLKMCGSGVKGVEFLAAGDNVTLGGKKSGVSALVLYPEAGEVKANAGEVDENTASMLLKLDYNGVSALMTADLGFDGEQIVLASDLAGQLNADILKVGHHGSKYSTSDEFLAAVAPHYAIIQCGRNTFGHPTVEALDKLYACDIIVRRNDLDGAVMFDVKKGKISGVKVCAKTEYSARIYGDRR